MDALGTYPEIDTWGVGAEPHYQSRCRTGFGMRAHSMALYQR